LLHLSGIKIAPLKTTATTASASATTSTTSSAAFTFLLRGHGAGAHRKGGCHSTD
jgi:hypothetical protein